MTKYILISNQKVRYINIICFTIEIFSFKILSYDYQITILWYILCSIHQIFYIYLRSNNWDNIIKYVYQLWNIYRRNWIKIVSYMFIYCAIYILRRSLTWITIVWVVAYKRVTVQMIRFNILIKTERHEH